MSKLDELKALMTKATSLPWGGGNFITKEQAEANKALMNAVINALPDLIAAELQEKPQAYFPSGSGDMEETSWDEISYVKTTDYDSLARAYAALRVERDEFKARLAACEKALHERNTDPRNYKDGD